ncbi:MAG: ComEC family competence protein, partial [Candidatus Sericytochromatia bacterium]|nr:ComEC family competence protein [Candidatus Tanganyikabacteria bacterium]
MPGPAGGQGVPGFLPGGVLGLAGGAWFAFGPPGGTFGGMPGVPWLALALIAAALLFGAAALLIGRVSGCPAFALEAGRPADRLLPVVCVGLAAAFFGCGYGLWRRPVPGPDDLAHLAPLRHVRVQARVLTAPVRGDGQSWRCEVAPVRVLFPRWRPGGGRAVVSWRPAGAGSASGTAEPPGVGDRILVTGSLRALSPPTNPGQPDAAASAARRGVFARLAAREVRVEAPSQSLWQPLRAAADLRERAVAIVGRGLPAADAALAGSLLFGAGAVPVGEGTRDRFSDLGLAHLLAASGMQVTLLVGLGAGLCRAAGLGPVSRLVAGGCLAAGYAAMCGFAPSVLRSAWMSGAALAAEAVGRPTTGLRVLWLSALVLLLVDPALVRDLGFQFSFLATWGLLTTARRWERRLRRLCGIGPPGAAERDGGLLGLGALARGAAFGVSHRWSHMVVGGLICAAVTPLAAMVWCLPLQLAHFGQLSLWSLPANLFAALLVVWLTQGGFALAALGLAWEPVAGAAPWVVGVPIAALQAGVGMLHEMPGAAIRVHPPPPW